MSIIPKITLKTLKQNKTRTIVTVIGVILSATMIFSVIAFTDFIRQGLINSNIKDSGNWFFQCEDISAEKLKELESDKRLEALSAVHEIGCAEMENSVGGKPYYRIFGANQDYFENMPIQLDEGRYPKNSNEIIISERAIREEMDDLHIGDKLILDIDKPIENQTSTLMKDEKNSVKQHKEYTIVGILLEYENDFLKNKSLRSGYFAFTTPDSNAEKFNIYCRTYNVEDISTFIADHNLTVKNESDMEDQLYYLGLAKHKDLGNFNLNIFSLIKIPILIIILCSIALLYNAFSISVSERARQFGLLSSVGTTKKQIRFAVMFEAFFISIIGIPVGIIAGIGMVSFFIKTSISLLLIFSAFFISVITVFISAWIPSRRAAKYIAIESIRQTKEIKVKKKSVKSSRITQKLFGFEGMLGAKYFKRNRRKHRAAVISLSISIILFISLYSFVHYFVDIADFGIYDGVYDIEMTTNFDDELDLEKLYKISKTDNTVTSSEYNEYVSLYSYNEDILYSSEYANSFSSKDNSMPELTPVLNFIDDESYLQLLERENLDKAKFTNREKPLAIIYNKKSFRNYNINKSYFLPYLDESMTKLPVMYPKQKEGYESYPNLKGKLIIRYNLQDRSDCIYEKFDDNMLYSTLDIGTYIQSPILSTSGSMHQYQIDIIYPKSLMNEVLKDFESEELNINKMMHFTSANPKVLYDKLLKNAENMGINKRFLFVKLGTADDYNRMNQMIQTICYGFIILISLIAAANVFNTISMNASLYRREFAIMKSVGMTGGGLRKMLSFECIVLGIRALLFGLPLSVVFTYRIYRFFDFDMGTDFYIPWQAIVIAASGVFTVAFVSMMYAIHKAKNENIIDTLKNENF